MFDFSTSTYQNIYSSCVFATFGILSYIDSKKALLEYRVTMKSSIMPTITDDDLKKALLNCGKIMNLDLVNDKRNQNEREVIVKRFYTGLLYRALSSLFFPVSIVENIYANTILFFNKNI